MSYHRIGDTTGFEALNVLDSNAVTSPITIEPNNAPGSPVVEGAFKNLVGSIAGLFGGSTPTPTKPTGLPGRLSPKPNIWPTIAVAGLLIGAVIYLSKKANQ